MKFRLIHKLLIALFASAALVLLLIFWVAKVNIGRGFTDFLAQQERVLMPELADELSAWYEQRGSWAELQQDPRIFHRMLNSIIVDQRRGEQLPPHAERRGPGRHRPPPADRPPRKEGPGGRKGKHGRSANEGALHRRVFILDPQFTPVFGHSPRNFPRENLIAIETSNEIVGWLGAESPRKMLAPTEQAFVKRIGKVLWLGLALGLGVAGLLAWILARHFGQPVSAAAGGIRKLAKGDYGVEVKSRGTDEIAQLGQDVNRLAIALSENRSARQRWMADMAHELRTPLAIIQGELEAIDDGVRPLNAESLSSIREEVLSLGKLVDDLNQLAMSDSGALSYQMEVLDISRLTGTTLTSFDTRARESGIELTAEIPVEPVKVFGDDQRLRQLLRIVLDNALLYTDAPGKIEVILRVDGEQVCLIINDSPPGVPETECLQLFERLYRLEDSRNRNTGGSGLGLAIARNIVAAHEGSITASRGHLGGLQVSIELKIHQ